MRLNQNGSIFIPAMIVAFIAGAGFYVLASTASKLSSQNSFINAQITATMVRDRVAAAFQNDENWKTTVNANATLSCLAADGRDCGPAGVARAFDLLDQEGKPVGSFDKYGAPCAPGGSDCVFIYDFEWKPVYESASTISIKRPDDDIAIYPGVSLDAKMRINLAAFGVAPGGRLPAAEFGILNPSLYSLTAFERGKTGDTLKAACLAVGGRFIQSEERCELRVGHKPPCGVDEAQYMSGVDPDGDRICKGVVINGVNDTCPGGSALLGVQPGWGFVCGKF